MKLCTNWTALSIAALTGCFLSLNALLPSPISAHEIGDGSSVAIETKLVINDAEPIGWPEARGLASCVQAGLLSQKRSGAYTLTGWVRHWETDTIHNTVAIVLHGDDGMITKFDREFGGRDPRQLISHIASPTFDLFTHICGKLTQTQITFTPVPSPGQAAR